MNTELLVIRHGRAQNNDVPAPSDRIDEDAPLTEVGRAQIRRLAASEVISSYRSAAIFSSTLDRAKETAHLLFPSGDVVYDPAFNEIRTDLHFEYRYHVPDEVLRQQLYASKCGETIMDIHHRAVSRVGQILALHPRLVLVTHAGVLNVLYHHFAGVSITLFPVLHVDNACGILFRFSQGQLTKLSFVSP